MTRAILLLSALPLLAQPPAGYKLVWNDDFSGSALDTEKWMYRTDVKVESSQRPENVTVEDGYLIIHLRKEDHRGKSYTAGGVISKQRFRYGYYEARVRMHGAPGWHQSIWAMLATDGSTTYPNEMRTEIDGMEFDSDLTWKGHMGLIQWDGRNPAPTTPARPASIAAHSASTPPLAFITTASSGPQPA